VRMGEMWRKKFECSTSVTLDLAALPEGKEACVCGKPTLPKLSQCVRCYWKDQTQLSCFVRMYDVKVTRNLQPYLLDLGEPLLPAHPGLKPIPTFSRARAKRLDV
jgi:hypothetical protein